MSETTPEQGSDLEGPEHLATLDLGSNSFHLLVVRRIGGELVVVDRVRERVRLAGGLDVDGRLTREAQERALACLERFGERLSNLPRARVRAVGTNTLRKARNSLTFLIRARKALGHPIEVISGREEARLIYLGVARTLALEADGRRLVIDIGGGSTECIVGEGMQPLSRDSMYMGCVSFSLRFFPEGELSMGAFDAAEVAARLELEPVVARTRKMRWDEAVGASGTIRAVERILIAKGWTTEGISAAGLDRLRATLIDAGQLSELKLPGLSEDRRPVIAGGVAVLRAVFAAFGLERMSVAPGALREGVLYDLIGRLEDHDVREQTVAAMQRRFPVDRTQAERVAATATSLFDQVRHTWKLDPEGRRTLRWAAMLHEIGLEIAYSGYHRHGAYILRHADMAGFSQQEQAELAALVEVHRRRFKAEAFGPVRDARVRVVRRLAILLRLAVRLNRSRDEGEVPGLRLSARGSRLVLGLPESWLTTHPLTEADLAREQAYLESSGHKLQVEHSPEPAEG